MTDPESGSKSSEINKSYKRIQNIDDDMQIIFRTDVGEFAHPITTRGYTNPVDHYNIELQRKTAAGKWKSSWSYHLLLDKDKNIKDIF